MTKFEFNEKDLPPENDSEKEWQDMPEFVQDKTEPFAKIIVRFDSEEDLNEFANLIGQKLTPKTQSIWHPEKSHWGNTPWRWDDES
jgi:hypothetical protein